MSIEHNDDGQSELSPSTQNHKLIVGELKRLTARDPQEVLSSLLLEFFQSSGSQKGQSVFSEESLDEAMRLFNAGDVMESLSVLTQNFIDIPIRSSSPRKVRYEEKQLAALLAQSNTISKELFSEILKMGVKSHNLAELVECFGLGDLKKLRPPDIILKPEIQEGKIVAINLEPKENSSRINLLSGKEEPLVKTEISFPEPLTMPKDDETEEKWALGIIRECRDVFKKLNCMPEKPHDVSMLLKNQEARASLLKLIEISHFIFGNELLWDNGDGGSQKRTVSLEYPDEFSILNLLSITRLIDESEDTFSRITNNELILKELALGDLQIINPNPDSERKILGIKGGAMDLVKFSWAGEEIKRGLTFSQVVRYIEDEVRCQRAKYIRVHPDHPEKISRRSLLRNLRSEFKLLYELYGKDLFTFLCLDVDDLKFRAGDGGWGTMYNPENLPDIKHETKMKEYLFLVASQLCCVEKLVLKSQDVRWGEKSGEKEKIILSVEEITDFILRYDLFKRIKGRIRYQFSAEEIVADVAIPQTREELQTWAKNILKIKEKLADGEEKKLMVLKTLKTLIPKERLSQLQFVLSEQIKLPEELKIFCCEVNGRFYLIVDELRNFFEMDKKHIVKNAVFYKEYGVWVINLGNFSEKNSNLRIAVDKKGKFIIKGLESENFIEGGLLTTREMRGVRETVDVKFNDFKEKVSDFLLERGILEKVDRGFLLDDGRMIDGEGNKREVVEGKPLVCKTNVMTGKWYLDHTLLKEAIESLGGRKNFGFDKLYNHAFGETVSRSNVFCPLPQHDNIHTEAATVYRGEKGRHLFCFVCREQIGIRTGRGVVKFEPTYKITEGLEPDDYKPVTLTRNRIFGEIIRIGEEFVAVDKNPQEYIASRGLEVSDIGKVGYIPPALSSFLFDLLDNEAYHRLIKAGGSRFLTLDAILSHQGFDPAGLDSFLNTLPPDLRDDVSRTFSLGNLRDMSLRGIISERKRKDGSLRDDTLGGRLLFPTHWVSSPNQLGIANWIGRGVEIEGVALYKGVKQHKVRLGKQKREENIRKIIHPTPAGIWLRDKDFITRAKEIVVLESPLNGASLGRIVPNYSKNCIAVVGTGYRELIAFLKWIRFGSGERKTIYLGNDYDQGGTITFIRTKEHLKSAFPDAVDVLPVRDILPDDIRPIIPPYDLKLFEYEDEEKKKKVRGPLYGQSLDLNEILTLPGLGRKYAYKGLEIEKEKTRRFLEAINLI